MRKFTATAALAAVLSLLLLGAAAHAQTSPNFTFGYVPTVAQWNALFAGKQDYLGAPPLLTTGGTMVGPLGTTASITGAAGLNIPPGTAPTTPNAGDVWTDNAGFYSRINGVTYNLISPASTCPACAMTNVANVFTAAVQTVQGATTTSPGWYAQITGDTVARVRVGLNATDVPSLAFGPGGASNRDTFIERVAVGNLRFGAPDAASPVAQVSSVQNVVAGTSNTAGANRTYAGSQGTGTGVGGDIVFQTAPAGGSGTAQNALANAAVIKGSGAFQIVNSLAIGGASIGGNALAVTGTSLFNSGVTLGAALTYGGVTLSNSVSGTGSMVLSASPSVSALTVTSSFTATGLVTLADLVTGSQDTVLGYWGSTAASALAINNCSNALIYSTTTHTFGCNATAGTGTVTTTGSPLANQTAVFTGATAITGVTNGSTGQSLHANTGAAPTYQSGGWVLLNTLTAANTAQLTDTTSLTATYNEYEIVLEDIVSVTANVSCQLQIHSGGSFQATSYATAQLFGGTGGAGGNATPTTYVPCSVGGSVSSFPTQASIRVNNPSTTAIHQFMATFASSASGPSNFIGGGAGFWNSSAAVDGFLVQMSSGNFSGKVKIYGRL